MANPGIGKCVHCLEDGVERNWDHVFPRSWYPDTTPENLHKWQMPSCIPCNREHGKVEEDLLARFGLSLDTDHPASKGVIERALRSTNPNLGKSERDKRAREAFKKRILAKTLQGAAIPHEATLPGMHDRWGTPKSEQVAVLVPKDSLEKLTRKIVRGLVYIEEENFIEPPYEIDVFVLSPEGAKPTVYAIDRWGKTYAREPGLVIRRAVSEEDGITSLFEVYYWQQFKLYASVTA